MKLPIHQAGPFIMCTYRSQQDMHDMRVAVAARRTSDDTHVDLCLYAKFAVILNISFRAGVRNFCVHSKNKPGGPACNSLTPALSTVVCDVTQCSLVQIS
jgi:hypothetical protein